MYKPPRYEPPKAPKTTPPGSAAATRQPATGQQYDWKGDQLIGMGTPAAAPYAPTADTFWGEGQPAQNAAATSTQQQPVDGLQAYVEGGGDWGPFGSGVEGYARWFDQFAAEHNREATEQDVVDFFDGVSFWKSAGRAPTEKEWKNRWDTGTWDGAQYTQRAVSQGKNGNTYWSNNEWNPALRWWS